MTTILDRLIELEAKATPACWVWGGEDHVMPAMPGKADRDLIVALRNAAPTLLALAKASRDAQAVGPPMTPEQMTAAFDGCLAATKSALAQLTKEIE